MWMNWNRAKSAFIIVVSFASLNGVAVPTGHEPGKVDSLNRTTNDWSGYKTAIDKLKRWAEKAEGQVDETNLADGTVTVKRSKDDLNKMAVGVEKILEFRKLLASKACENDAIAISIGEMLDHCMGKALVRAMNSGDQSFSFSYLEWSACRAGIPEVLKAMQDKVPSENRREFAAAWAAKLEMENISRIIWGESFSGEAPEGSEDEQRWKTTVEDAKSKALSAIQKKQWKEFCKWNESDTTTTPNGETSGGTSEYKPNGEAPPPRDNAGGGNPRTVTETQQGGYGGSQYFPGQAPAAGVGAGYQTPPPNYDALKGLLSGLYTPPPTPYVPPIQAPSSGPAGSSAAPPPPLPAPLPPPLPFSGVGVGVQTGPRPYPPPPPPFLPPAPLPYLPPPPPPAYAEVPPPPPDLFKFKVNITSSPSPTPKPYGSSSMAMMNPMMMCMQLPPQIRMTNPLCMQMQQPGCPSPSICGGAYPQPYPGAIPGITTVASIQPLPTTPPVTGYPNYPTTVPGGYPSTSLTSLGQNPYATPTLGVPTVPPTTFGTGTMGTTYPSLTPFGQPATQPLPTV